ncbi:hypothetical protein ABEB36_015037 [Hypothenemus hampei]|uniref:Uncharacterized protein n=1 Tax=Hypothenemus hampei TaxID=57062 RepID=A0ABD1E1M2_HYPHA
MYETGISTTTNKSPKVVERSQLTTIIGYCNAFLPPFLIFARKKMQLRLLDEASPGSELIINQYDVARLLSPAYLKTAVAMRADHGFERPSIWLVNKHAFGDEDFESAAVIVGKSNMNISTEITNPLQLTALPESIEEISSIHPVTFIQEPIS